jgi:hypothetical protein
LEETSTNVAVEEYAVIQLGSGPVLPPRPPAPRGPPLTVEQWARFQDKDGRITEVETVKDIIFRGVSYICRSSWIGLTWSSSEDCNRNLRLRLNFHLPVHHRISHKIMKNVSCDKMIFHDSESHLKCFLLLLLLYKKVIIANTETFHWPSSGGLSLTGSVCYL